MTCGTLLMTVAAALGTTEAASDPAVVDVAAGHCHTLVILDDGKLEAWGDNRFGQLGDDPSEDRLVLTEIGSPARVIEVAPGYFHTLALCDDGTIWAWGLSEHGQCGYDPDISQNTRIRSSSPVQVRGVPKAIAVATGLAHTAALTEDGVVWTWGRNDHGQLGDGTIDGRLAPAAVAGLTDVSAVATGYNHTLALRKDGTVWAWGHNLFGQLGDGTTERRFSPVRVDGLKDIVALASGYRHNLAVSQDGALWAWGGNARGELGNGTTMQKLTPVRVAEDRRIVAVSAGYAHSLALDADGAVWAWGGNNFGQVGDGTQTPRPTPVRVPGVDDVRAIAAGDYHSAAVAADGAVYSWGLNNHGQLGDGTTRDSAHPVSAVSSRPETIEPTVRQLYVATNGDDLWTGRMQDPSPDGSDGPFATLTRARDAIRELKRRGFDDSVVVQVRGGKYFLGEAFRLTAEDSGTPDHPVTYSAYPGERPVLSGGVEVAGWEQHSGQILTAASPIEGRFRCLFFDGERQVRARTPNVNPDPLRGWASAEGFRTPGENDIRYRPGQFPNQPWAKPTTAEVVLQTDFMPIASVDEAERVITGTVKPRGAGRVSEPGHFFIVENLLEELDQPGEWCVDPEDRILYFWPPKDVDSGSVVVPVLERLIEIEGASHVRISGFTLTETQSAGEKYDYRPDDWGLKFTSGVAVWLHDTSNCEIEDNLIEAVAGEGIVLDGPNARTRLHGNTIANVGHNGIVLLPAFGETNLFTEITDNEVHHCGSIYRRAAALFLGASDGGWIAHNSFHDVPDAAINLGHVGGALGDEGSTGRDVIEYNEFRNTVSEMYDKGAINAAMSPDRKEIERRGHVIQHNFSVTSTSYDFRDDTLRRPAAYDIQSFYLDNYTSNCLVYGNILVNSAHGLTLHAGRGNVVVNNVIVGSRFQYRICDYASNEDQYGGAGMSGYVSQNRFLRNVHYTTDPDAVLYTVHDWDNRLITQSDYGLLHNTTGVYRIAYRSNRTNRWVVHPPYFLDATYQPLAYWREAGYDRHSLVADPLIANPHAATVWDLAAGLDLTYNPDGPWSYHDARQGRTRGELLVLGKPWGPEDVAWVAAEKGVGYGSLQTRMAEYESDLVAVTGAVWGHGPHLVRWTSPTTDTLRVRIWMAQIATCETREMGWRLHLNGEQIGSGSANPSPGPDPGTVVTFELPSVGVQKGDVIEFRTVKLGGSDEDAVGAWVGFNVRIEPVAPASARDFRLLPGSPAFHLGFEQIDVERIGMRRRVLRRS